MSASDRLASLEDYASCDFEAWSSEGVELPTEAEWLDHLRAIRLAATMMKRTKAGMMRFARETEGDVLFGLYDGLLRTRSVLTGCSEIVGAANARLLVGASALLMEQSS